MAKLSQSEKHIAVQVTLSIIVTALSILVGSRGDSKGTCLWIGISGRYMRPRLGFYGTNLHWPAEQSKGMQQSPSLLHGELPVPQQTGLPMPSVARAHERFVSVPQHSLVVKQSSPNALPVQVGQTGHVGHVGHFFRFFFFFASLVGAEASKPVAASVAPASAVRSALRRDRSPMACASRSNSEASMLSSLRCLPHVDTHCERPQTGKLLRSREMPPLVGLCRPPRWRFSWTSDEEAA
jgi:hypothetical protein